MNVKELKHKPNPLTAAVILGFFNGSDAQKAASAVAKVEGSRLQYLTRHFEVSDVATVKAAIKEYKADGKDKQASEKRVIQTRAGEIQALYGAYKLGGLKLDGFGYHDAVAESRKTLKEKGLKWDGARIPEKFERDIAQDVRRKAEIEMATRIEIAKREKAGEEVSENAAEEIEAEMARKMERADMNGLAAALVKKHGVEKSAWLIEAMEAEIAVAQQAAKDTAAQQKAA